MNKRDPDALRAAFRAAIGDSTNRCPDYCPDEGSPCDGLIGCDECLDLVAQACLEEV